MITPKMPNLREAIKAVRQAETACANASNLLATATHTYGVKVERRDEAYQILNDLAADLEKQS